MDGKTLRDKLVGSDDERAVSPVIGVILMVAITVILAAVIATLVMDFGDSTESPINAHVDSEVSSSNNEVTLTVTEAGSAESFDLRGETGALNESGSDLEDIFGGDPATGKTATFNISPSNSGSINIVAIEGDKEENAGSIEIE